MAKRKPRPTVRELKAIGDPEDRLRAVLAARQRVWDEANDELVALGVVASKAISDAAEQGVNQSELARRLGLSRQRLSQLARGSRT